MGHIYLLRHGQSISNTRRGYIAGRTDQSPLTSKGRIQAARAAKWVSDTCVRPFVIYTSPVPRARLTADAVGAVCGCAPIVTDILTEYSYGSYEGSEWSQVRINFDEFEVPYPGGESLHGLASRIHEHIDSLRTQSDIILVTHLSVIAAIIAHYDGIVPSESRRYFDDIHVPNGAIWQIGVGLVSQEPVAPSVDSVSQYIQGLEGTTPQLTEQKTVGNVIYIAQSPHTTEVLKTFRQRDITLAHNLVRLYEYLHAHSPIPTPQILRFDDTGLYFRELVVTESYITGRTQDQIGAISYERPVMEQVSDMLDQLHAIPVSEVGDFWRPNDWHIDGRHTWKHFISRNIADVGRRLGAKDRPLFDLVEPHLHSVFDHVHRGAYIEMPIHGDFSTEHVMLETLQDGSHRIVGIVDFEWARIGDGVWDHAYYLGWLDRVSPRGAEVYEDVLKGKSNWSEIEARVHEYRILFHAWTVSDGLRSTTSTTRSVRAAQSHDWLMKHLS